MPVFFRLTRPHRALAGYGFFAAFVSMRLDLAWETFTWRNGARDLEHLLSRVGLLRKEDLARGATEALPVLGCNLLRDVRERPRGRGSPR